MVLDSRKLACCLLLLSGTASAKTRVAVHTLKAEASLQSLADRATEQILVNLGRRPGFIVISEEELRLLGQHAEERMALDDCEGAEACLAKVSAAADAEKILTGRIGPWGKGFMATLKKSDVKNAVFEGGESCTAETESELLACVASAAERLFEASGESERFTLPSGTSATKLAVLNLEAYGLEAGVAETLTQLLSLELKRIDGVSVISRDEVKAMFQFEFEKQVLTCESDMSCLVEIGGAMGVDYLVAGGVGTLDDTYVITLKLLNVGEGKVAHRVSETFHGPQAELAKPLKHAAHAMLGVAPHGEGTLEVLSDIDDLVVSINGSKPLDDTTAPVTGLAAGKHSLHLSALGYRSRARDVYVDDGTTTKLRASLIEIPNPWYEKWWVWTIVGGVAAAAVTTTLVFATDSPDNGIVDVTVRRQMP